MLEAMINGTNFEKGLFVTLIGMLGVFFVLILFYVVIKGFTKLFPYKPEEDNN